MSAERYARAARIFHEALDLPADRRAGLVREACAGDERLRQDVASLLAAHDRAAGRFIEVPAIQVAAALIAEDEANETIPPRIGHYDVVSLIASGGMGVVYEGRDPVLGRSVALKVPKRAIAAEVHALNRFEHEARAASSLNHPNIVTIYEIGNLGGGWFIAMELVDGRPLASMIGQPVPPPLLVRIGRQLAQALSVAHAAGIVHGDVKPANLMLRTDGYVKVLDFGLARLLPRVASPAAASPRVTSRALGTPRYLSPEQARGEAASAASDIFACGLVLYELAAGRHPFEEDAVHGIRLAAARRPVPRLREDLAVPPALERLIARMLDAEPAMRPAAREVETELSAIEDAWQAAREPRKPAHNLPPQRTPFVGRTAEMEALAALLLDPATRLVTLTGTAGTGKTRLALQVAAHLAGRFEGGVSFVNLAPLTDPALVAAAVAQAHGVREVAGRALVPVLCSHLHERGAMLVLLDNFEQVAGAAPLVQELLDACPRLTVLVTSRLVLHLYGEHEFPVPPLPLPESAAIDGLMACASVALFVQRAAAVSREFTLTDTNAAAVAAICRRLDGLPLAIELAAARVKILPPGELLARLEHRLDLLGGHAPGRPERQQTLRSAIDWSYFLLSPGEQVLFRRMSVFAGGCTLEAAEAVCNAAEDLPTDVLQGVTALVDNSLLMARGTSDGRSRFVMLETIREYARERLEESGESAAVRRAHAAYALVVAEEESSEMLPAEREEWLRWCDREHDNLRAAMQYLVSVGNADWGVRLGAALFRFWEQREHLTEGREALATVLAIPWDGPPTRARARARLDACMLADVQGDRAAAQAGAHAAYAMFEELGDVMGVATTMHVLARQAQVRGRYAEARDILERAAALWDRLGEAAIADMARNNLATVAKEAGDHDAARAVFERLADSADRRGDPRARASALNELGDLAATQSDGALALRHHHESLAIFRRIGDQWGVARVLTDLAAVHVAAGDYDAAERLVTEALHIGRALGHQRGVARRLELLAWCAVRRARYDRAVRLASAAARIRQRIGVPGESLERRKVEAAVDEARVALGSAFGVAWKDGQTMALDEVLA